MIPADLRGAVSFLTRLPVSTPQDPAVARWVPWFPVVGALIGGLVGGVYALATTVLPPLVAAGLAVGAGVLVTGGFHEDGLGDTADALGGARSPDDAIRILKDPRLGTFGVLAIGLSLLLRTAAVASMDRWAALSMLVCAHAAGRAAAIALLGVFEPHSDAGLGASYARALSTSDVVATVAGGALLGILAAGVWGVPALALGLLVAWPLGRLAETRLAGVTGDVLGAAEQAAETAILLLGSAIVTNGWVSAAWWS